MPEQDFEKRLHDYLAKTGSDDVPVGLEDRVLAAPRHRSVFALPPRTALALVAAGAVAVIAVAAVAANVYLLRTRSSSLPASTITPSPSPSLTSKPGPTPENGPNPAPEPFLNPFPLVDVGPVPTGTHVFYLVDARNLRWLQAFDWNGKNVGTVKLPVDAASDALSPYTQTSGSPQGSRIRVNSDVYDSNGNRLGAIGGISGKSGIRWANDDRHVCGLEFSEAVGAGPFHSYLIATAAGQAFNRIADFPEQTIGQTGSDVASCNFATGRAVVVRTSVYWPVDWWLVDLGTGSFLKHQTEPSEYLSSVVASEDSKYLAENAATLKQADAGLKLAQRTRILTVASGAHMDLPREIQVDSFSADDQFVLVTNDNGLDPPRNMITARGTTRSLWVNPDDTDPVIESKTQPGGSGFVLAFARQKETTALVKIVVMDPSQGSRTIDLPGRWLIPW
jgi:hypothetical protein